MVVTVVSRETPGDRTTTTAPDGSFSLEIPGPGVYEVKAELTAFADVLKSVTIDASCRATVELQMVLASRVPKPAPASSPAPAPAAPAQQARTGQPGAPAGAGVGPAGQRSPGAAASGRGAANGTTTQGETAASATDDSAAVAAQLSLPPGFSIDTSGESVATRGAAGQINPNLMFGPPEGGPGGMMGGPGGFPGMGGAGQPDAGAQGGFGAMGGGMPQFGGPGMGGGRGGGMEGGGPGMEGGRGGGPGGGGRGGLGGLAGAAGRLQMAGRLQQNRLRVQLNYNLSGSPFNAQPYAINGQASAQPTNLQHRFGINLGGQARIPGLFDLGSRSNFFLNYNGNHGSSLHDSYSRVPTLAQRAGDFSASMATVYDPLTGGPFANNQIPADRISAAARTLLGFYPAPNQDSTDQNYHYETTTATHSDDINFRFMRSFGTVQPGRGGLPGGGRGGMGGPGGRGGGSANLSIGVNYRRSSSDQTTGFPALGGKNRQTGWNVPVGFTFQKWGLFNTLNLQYNRSHSTARNAFAFTRDVAGEAGIIGVATDAFSWGVPTLSFTSISGLRDITPSERTDQTITFSATQMKMYKRHNFRWGGDVRSMMSDSRTDSNPRGSFVFTGLYSQLTKTAGSGNDVADFLLGLPQQASLQYGPGMLRFRSTAWSLYFQDDWRVRSNLTINAGFRYEYLSPYREVNNHLVNLDVPSDFTAAVPIEAGQSGPFNGRYPNTIVEPDWNNIAPRIGIAWRPKPKLIVRVGYGINYSSPVYQGIAQKLAAQPPFAVTDTRIGTTLDPLTIAAAFATPSADKTTNNFGVDRNYDLGYLHMWSLDVARDLTRTINAGIGYVGTRGASLDMLRAPNRGPGGLLIPGVQAFTWESSGGHSIMHALSLRLRKRPTKGIGGGLTYTWSKAMDNASTIGGGAGTVAQNDKDLDAEWSLSSFDQRHRLTADVNLELPFGPNRRWLNNDSVAAKILGAWSWNMTVTFATGTPLTARVLGNTSDVARGVNGTLRADWNGQAIAVDHPTILAFFNTGAFSVPAAGTFGNSARNLIVGPGQHNASMSLMKTVQIRQGRSISLRVQANNVFNTVQFGSIDTTVNSPTFGRVLSVRSMRSVQFNVRMGF